MWTAGPITLHSLPFNLPRSWSGTHLLLSRQRVFRPEKVTTSAGNQTNDPLSNKIIQTSFSSSSCSSDRYKLKIVFPLSRIIEAICFGDGVKSLEDAVLNRQMALLDRVNSEVGNGFLEDVVPLLHFWPTRKYTRIKGYTDEFQAFLYQARDIFVKSIKDNLERKFSLSKSTERIIKNQIRDDVIIHSFALCLIYGIISQQFHEQAPCRFQPALWVALPLPRPLFTTRVVCFVSPDPV